MDLSKIIEQLEEYNTSMLIKPKKPFILIRLIHTNKNKMTVCECYLNTFEANDKKITETILELRDKLFKSISDDRKKENKNTT